MRSVPATNLDNLVEKNDSHFPLRKATATVNNVNSKVLEVTEMVAGNEELAAVGEVTEILKAIKTANSVVVTREALMDYVDRRLPHPDLTLMDKIMVVEDQ
jgi:hypothetical protein